MPRVGSLPRNDRAEQSEAVAQLSAQTLEQAELFAMNGHREKAIERIDEAVQLGANEFWAERFRGIAALNADAPHEAAQHFERAIELGDNSVTVHWLLGKVYLDHMGHDRRGREHLKITAATKPVTQMDEVFHAINNKDSATYFDTTNRAYEETRSLMMLRMRSEAAKNLAWERRDLGLVDQAIEDADAVVHITGAKDLMRVFTRTAAINIAQRNWRCRCGWAIHRVGPCCSARAS